MDNPTNEEKLRQQHSEFLRLEQTQVVFRQLCIQRLKLLEQAEALTNIKDGEDAIKQRLIEARTIKRILDILEDTEKFISLSK